MRIASIWRCLASSGRSACSCCWAPWQFRSWPLCVPVRVPYVPAAAGAFAAFAAHAGIDWDWEVVGLTATAFVAAAVGLVAAGATDRPLTLQRAPRIALPAVALAVAAFAFRQSCRKP